LHFGERLKTVRKGKEIRRVSNEEAAKLVDQGWQYCGKYEWKRQQEKVAHPFDKDMKDVMSR
jgi:hypothetical protein